MNILLVTDCYPPEIRTISYMMKELAEELTLRGHNIVVATCWPQYNLSQDDKQAKFSVFAVENGVKIIRVKTLPHHNVNFIVRGIAQLSLPYLFLMHIKKFVKQKIDAVIVYAPPLPLALVGIKIKKIYGAKFLLNVQDIFPQNAIDLGIMKNKALIKFFERMERKAYQNADKIASHTENSRKFLIEKRHIPQEKVTTVSDWIDFEAFADVRTTGRFRERFGLKDRFVFLFPGILGPSQNLDFIINIARKITDIPEICFLFVGDGTEKNRLQKLAEEYGLKNVKFEPFIPMKDSHFLVKEMNVGLACLSARNTTSATPGKIFAFMASQVSVVAFLNKENDVHNIIREAQCGYSMVADDTEMAAALIRKVFAEKNKLALLGRNGYNYAANHFSKRVCIDKLEGLIR